MPSLDLKVPEDYLAILHAVQTVYSDAVIAGGCLRDLLFGVTPKDLDIFVGPGDIQPVSDALSPISYLMGLDASTHDEYKGSSFILASIDYTGKSIPLNLVVVDNVAKIPEEFDFGLNQIVYRDGVVQVTDAFLEDHRNRTFTLKWCENQERFARCMIRFRRLHIKYPEFKLFIPPQFSDMEAAYAQFSSTL